MGILTSGGDAPGMNAAIRSAVRCAAAQDMQIMGIYHGYEGLIDGKIEKLDISDVGDILHRGGTILKTARSSRFMTEEGVRKAADMAATFDLSGIIVIGGNGSFKGAYELSQKGIPVVGIPGTIDNDLAYTDYTIGFNTAVETVLDAISKIRDTSSAHDRNTVIEVMGRKCGDIALYAGLSGGATAVMIPEKQNDINAVCRKIIEGFNRGKLHSLILNAEGSGIATNDLVNEIEKKTGKETRPVVLGYLQRGGSPTMEDRILATLCAQRAVELLSGECGCRAVGTVDGRIRDYPMEDALKMERPFRDDYYELIDILSR